MDQKSNKVLKDIMTNVMQHYEHIKGPELPTRAGEGGKVKIHISYEKEAQGVLVIRLLQPLLNLPEARIKQKKDTLRGRKHVYITI